MSSWPFEQASLIPKGDNIVFETGFGPSGLPTLATLAEVVRTSWVRHAYQRLNPDVLTRLIVFSDDLDAMRKVPDNAPNPEMLKPYLGYSLSSVPDPFGTHESFAHHNNAKLREFLDGFGLDYEFRSSTEMYRSGAFDATLRLILDNYETVCDIIKPTLGEDRRATYCPFMPIMADGRVLQEGYLRHDAKLGRVWFRVDNQTWSFPVTGGHCKLQWKVDWAMRWIAQGVNYEMAGKDLIDSVNLSSKIVRSLGHKPPEGFIYEMFLDEDGKKISKSVGNGLTVDEWLRYGPPESLAFFLFREPKKAKKIYAALVPRAIDEYWLACAQYHVMTQQNRLGNAAYHIHNGRVPYRRPTVTFGLILNLVGILGDVEPDVVWSYIVNNYSENANPRVRELIPYALNYHKECVANNLQYRSPTPSEAKAMLALCDELDTISEIHPLDVQTVVYTIGKQHGYADDLRGWFGVFYEVLFGASEGPRLGAFVAVYGRDNFIGLVRRACTASLP